MTAHARVQPALWIDMLSAAEMQREMDAIGPLLLDVLNRRDSLRLFRPSDVLDRCADGRWQMWAAFRPALVAICVTNVEIYPLAKVLNFLLLAGHDMVAWLPGIRQIHQWARGHDCTVSQVYGRRGWSRLLEPLGFKHECDMMRMAL